MSYRPRVAFARSVTGAAPPTGKKLSHARWGVIPAASSTPIVASVTTMMINPARRAPDPVLGREGIDIGFLRVTTGPWASRVDVRGGVSGDARRPELGAPDAQIIPEGPEKWGPIGPGTHATCHNVPQGAIPVRMGP